MTISRYMRSPWNALTLGCGVENTGRHCGCAGGRTMSILLMLATVAVVAFLLLQISKKLARDHSFDELSKGVLFAEAIVTITAILLAAFWYFLERPDSAKVNVLQAASGVPIPEGHVMVLTELSIANVGPTVLDFKDSPYIIELQKVTPWTEVPKNEFYSDIGQAIPKIHNADKWSLIARFESDKTVPGLKRAESDTPGLTSLIESGETENLYHRIVISCEPELRLAIRSQIKKPRTWQDDLMRESDVYWTKQTYLDLASICNTAEGGKRK